MACFPRILRILRADDVDDVGQERRGRGLNCSLVGRSFLLWKSEKGNVSTGEEASKPA